MRMRLGRPPSRPGKALPFKVRNAPVTFTQLISVLFHSFIEDVLIVYLDDILVHISTWDVHLVHIEEVFDILKDEQLELNGKKYKFGKD